MNTCKVRAVFVDQIKLFLKLSNKKKKLLTKFVKDGSLFIQNIFIQ